MEFKEWVNQSNLDIGAVKALTEYYCDYCKNDGPYNKPKCCAACGLNWIKSDLDWLIEDFCRNEARYQALLIKIPLNLREYTEHAKSENGVIYEDDDEYEDFEDEDELEEEDEEE